MDVIEIERPSPMTRNHGPVNDDGETMLWSLQHIKAIAEAVAREEDHHLEIIGVMRGEARRGYVEIIAIRRGAGSEARVLTIGVDRELAEPMLQEQISRRLRP